jgi:hypothetical protein
VTLAKEEHTRKFACKGVFFFRQDSCEAALYINLSLATTYIGTPAFAGVSMSEVLMNKELNNNQVCDEVHLAKQLE